MAQQTPPWKLRTYGAATWSPKTPLCVSAKCPAGPTDPKIWKIVPKTELIQKPGKLITKDKQCNIITRVCTVYQCITFLRSTMRHGLLVDANKTKLKRR